MGRIDRLILTCEHGGNEVPAELKGLFRGRGRLLRSHRGWDPGSLDLAEEMAAVTGARLISAAVSRLVVDLNRSEENPAVWSAITAGLGERERGAVLRRHYRPHRRRVERAVGGTLAGRSGRAGTLVHVAVHTFTPVLRGERRRADIGLLFDPARVPEAAFAAAWRRSLRAALPGMRVLMNSPYKGTDDGLTTHLRTRFPGRVYAGIELEVNQRLVRAGEPRWGRVRTAIAHSLAEAMGDREGGE